MVSRIEVIPSEVRGYGNIVMAKSLEDFVPVESELSYSEDVYTLTALRGIFISLTASSSSINVGSNLTLSATVMDDDTPVSGVSVSFYDGTTSLGTGTTNSSGVATYITSSLSAGSHSLSAGYDDKTSNTVNVTVVALPYDGISLTGDKSILSYADGDTCTLSAQLMDGGSAAAVSGVTVEFFKDSVSLGTSQTNSSGVATKVYSSTGSGDVSFSAEVGSLLSETYVVEDCIDYQPMTSNIHQSRWTIPSAVTSSSIFGYSSDGWKFGNASSYSNINYNYETTNNFIMEFEVTEINDSSAPAFVTTYLSGSTSMGGVIFDRLGNYLNFFNTRFNNIYTSLSKYKIVITPNSQELFVNDVSIAYTTVSLPTPLNFRFSTGGNRSIRIKNFKIKPL